MEWLTDMFCMGISSDEGPPAPGPPPLGVGYCWANEKRLLDDTELCRGLPGAPAPPLAELGGLPLDECLEDRTSHLRGYVSSPKRSVRPSRVTWQLMAAV